MNGSIRRRGKGSWELRFDLPRGADGKRRRRHVTFRGTKAKGQRRLRELLASLDRGLPVRTGRATVEEYLGQWYADYVVPNTRPRTAERYSLDIRRHLVPQLGHVQLDKLSAVDIQAMEAAMLKAGLSPRSVLHAHRVLSQGSQACDGTGSTLAQRVQCRPHPRQVRKESVVPDPPTILRLLKMSVDTPYHAAFHFLAHTGARRGEACGLKWTDIDLDKSTASISRAAVRVKGQGVVMLPPKTDRSRRSIALDPETVDVLRAHRGAQLMQMVDVGEDFYEPQGFVFASPSGRPLDPFVLTDTWRHMTARARVEGIRLHDLRHFHASVLLRANVHPKIVQERLGHSTIQITLDTYSHSVPSMQQEAALEFSEVMRAETAKAKPESTEGHRWTA